MIKSLMHRRRGWHSVHHASHSNNQWNTSSTFPDWHSRHILSSLGSPRHRPLSIIRGAVPPLNIIITRLWLLLATSKHRDSLPFSFSSRKIANLGLVLSSHAHSSSIILFAQVSNMALTSPLDRPRTSSAQYLFNNLVYIYIYIYMLNYWINIDCILTMWPACK